MDAQQSYVVLILGALCLLVAIVVVAAVVLLIVLLARKRKAAETQVPHPRVMPSELPPEAGQGPSSEPPPDEGA